VTFRRVGRLTIAPSGIPTLVMAFPILPRRLPRTLARRASFDLSGGRVLDALVASAKLALFCAVVALAAGGMISGLLVEVVLRR